jgi:hypothetical protein
MGAGVGWGGGAGHRGIRTTPLGKISETDAVKIRYTDKKLKLTAEYPGFLRKRPPPFKILATPLTVNFKTFSNLKKFTVNFKDLLCRLPDALGYPGVAYM